MTYKMKVLANDGISKSGILALEKGGFEVLTTKVAQEQVANYINKNDINVLLVRSATKVTADLIDACPVLKIIGRSGVALNNIDVDHAKSKGIQVINAPNSSSEAVAELVFAHLFSGVRFLHDSNRNMPLEGDMNFDGLKKAYANGIELRGKTIGIIGMGSTAQATAKIALGLGMKVIATDNTVNTIDLKLTFFDGQSITTTLVTQSLESLLKEADFITLHAPDQDDYIIGEKEIESMKNGVGIINCAFGGVLDEVALVKALDSGKILFAGLDVYENEPTPEIAILMNPKISLTPHIGGATEETQERMDTELAKQTIKLFS
jgi:D-3-phosphoglycerate dehydrogenase